MELPLDLVPLVVDAADCDTAAVLAQVCKVAYAAVDAKFLALINDNVVHYDDKTMWLRGYLHIIDTIHGTHSAYNILPGPDISSVKPLSSAKITPPKMLVKKYFDYSLGNITTELISFSQ